MIDNSDQHLDPTRPDPTRPEIFGYWNFFSGSGSGRVRNAFGSGSGRVWILRVRVQSGPTQTNHLENTSIFIHFVTKNRLFLDKNFNFHQKIVENFYFSGLFRVLFWEGYCFGSGIGPKISDSGFGSGSGPFCRRVRVRVLDPKPDRVGFGSDTWTRC